MPIMFKLTIITKNGNSVTFNYGTFSSLVDTLNLYKNSISNMDEFAQFNIILPTE